MSFRLLSEEIIDVGLCQGCGLCAGNCKHIIMDSGKPKLDDFCIVAKNGLKCGKCYENCPQVKQLKVEKKDPLEILAVQSKDESIRENAVSGGFVTTLNKYLLDKKIVSDLVEVKNVNDRPFALVTSDPNEVVNYSGIAYGRTGVLKKLVEAFGEDFENIGIVGVPCEIRGAHYLEETMKKPIFKIGLFCNANIKIEGEQGGNIFSPCQYGCPAGVNASGYVNLIRQGKYQEAVDLIRDTNPLPSICGRVCTHECEHGCTLIGTNQPIAIRELKKFVTEWEMKEGKRAKAKPTGKKIAIIGSGPAGLTAAYYLAASGYRVTIFEKGEKAGGMLRNGVPKFRLPDKTLDYDIETVTELGVEIKYNTPLGPNLTFDDLKKQGFEAVFVAIGQYLPRTFKLEGEDLPNIHTAIDFLVKRKYRHWDFQDEFKDKTIGIMGGGLVAVDVAQTAIRLGAKKVTMVDIVSAETLEIVRDEVPENEKKFIEFVYDTSTTKFTQGENGKLVFNYYKVNSTKDANGRMNFNKIEGSDGSFEVDSIVIAVGQAVDYKLLDAAGGDKITRERGKIVIDETTFETSVPGVFAGGDIVSRGKNVAIAAIAHGRGAAISIDRYLKGEDLKEGRTIRQQSFFQGPKDAPKDVSPKAPLLQATEELTMNFDQIDGQFNEEMAIIEAKRCLSCNNFCNHCTDFAAVYADITAGDLGSEKGYTTVLVWTEVAKQIVHDMIDEGLLKKGEIIKEDIDKAISNKLQRKIIDHKMTPRERVLNTVKSEKKITISELSSKLDMPIKQVRYNALRLVQEQVIGMTFIDDDGEPIFTAEIEE